MLKQFGLVYPPSAADVGRDLPLMAEVRRDEQVEGSGVALHKCDTQLVLSEALRAEESPDVYLIKQRVG